MTLCHCKQLLIHVLVITGVPEDKDLSNLPNTVATRVEAVTESVEEDLRMDAESEAINTEEGQMDENNFDVPKV